MARQSIKLSVSSKLQDDQAAIIILKQEGEQHNELSKKQSKSAATSACPTWLYNQLSTSARKSLDELASSNNSRFGEVWHLSDNLTAISCGDKPLTELALSKLAIPLRTALRQTHANKAQICCEGVEIAGAISAKMKASISKAMAKLPGLRIEVKKGGSVISQASPKSKLPAVKHSADYSSSVLDAICLAAAASSYTYDDFKSKKSTSPVPSNLTILHPQPELIKPRLQQLQGIAQGIVLAKDLANSPPNHCTPPHLADQGRQLARQYKKISCKVLGEKELQQLNMNAYLAVTQGSSYPPQLVIMEYKGTKASTPPVVLVGKGMTFDTGGVSIKPSGKMDEMKYDMCGAASVFGTMKALAELELPINVVGMAVGAENSVDAKSYRPGDILSTMSGKSVEVLNTDAEGRLVLCDTLTYVAKKYSPRCVIDIATLTGACVIALGHLRSGMFANDDALARQVENAANLTRDLVWRLPMDKAYMEDMKSNFADIANVGNRSAGTITAAGFLAEFAQAYPWVHLDIAGTAWLEGARKGATGRPVPLLTQFLISACNEKL